VRQFSQWHSSADKIFRARAVYVFPRVDAKVYISGGERGIEFIREKICRLHIGQWGLPVSITTTLKFHQFYLKARVASLQLLGYLTTLRQSKQ